MTRILSVGIFLVLLAGSASLSERDIEFLLESDFGYTLMLQAEQLLKTGSWANISAPGPHVYLDGQYPIYGAAIAILRKIVTLPTDVSYSLAAVFAVNAISYAIGNWFFYRTVLIVSGHVWMAMLATAVLFLSPPMLAIDLLRLDFLIFGPLLAIIYSSTLFAMQQERLRHAILLGVAVGLLAGLKLNGIMYAAIPACALVARWRLGRAELRFIGLSAGCALVVLAVAFTRYFLYVPIAEIPQLFARAFAEVQQWSTYYPSIWNYYFTTLFADHGIAFVAAYLAAWALTTAAAILWRRPFDVFVALNLLWLGVFSLFVVKYVRGGYHLLPFYILAIVAISQWQVRAARYAVAAILLVGLVPAAVNYRLFLEERENRLQRITVVKREPREWLLKNVQRGTTICFMRHSYWAMPPVEDIGFKWIDGPFEFPYHNPAELAAYPVPSAEEVQSRCPIVMLGDMHRQFYDLAMRKASEKRAAEWQALFKEIETRFPPKVFTADKLIGGVSRVEIYDLRSSDKAASSAVTR